LWCYSECISTPGKLEKYAWPRWESNLRGQAYFTTVVRHIFQAYPVWIYTQSNITSIIFTRVHYTNTEKSRCCNTFVLTIWCLFIYFYVLSVFEYIFSCLITVWFNTHWSQTKFLTLDGLFKIQYSIEEKINTWNISI
jgi:hypothetical protein